MPTWSDRRRWSKELEDVSPDQFRAMVKGSHFHATPGKQRWAEQRLWRRENGLALSALAASVIGIVISLGALIVAIIALLHRAGGG
jgi:hypothetical protein